jgi:hypothetical protein
MPDITKESINGLARDMLRDREQVFRTLIKKLETLHLVEQGCAKIMDNWEEYSKNPENLEKVLKTAVKVNRQLSESMLQVMSILLVYVTSNDFSAGAATLMMKTGDPGEALREMFESKLRKK